MPVSMSDLDFALECTSTVFSFGEYYVYLNRESGELYNDSPDSEDEIPDDIDDDKKYIMIPNKTDLDLGKSLVLQFTSERIPERTDEVYEIFRRKGAYQRYKSMLSNINKLDEWFVYEAEQQKLALQEWCVENKIEICT